MALSFAEMEERDRRAVLAPDGREQIPESSCPCGEPVVDVQVLRDMVGGRNNVTVRHFHSRERYCAFRRVF